MATGDAMGDANGWTTIGHLVAAGAQRFGDAPAIVEPQGTLSFRELTLATRRCAAALLASGVEIGDRIAVWAPNISEFVVAAFGVHSAGGVLVPINTRFKGAEAADVITRSGARVLFAMNDFLGADHLALLEQAPSPPRDLELAVLLRGRPRPGAIAWEEFLDRGAGVGAQAVAARLAKLGPDDLCDVMFTSGTTGRPKGVMMSHGQTLRNMLEWCELSDLREGDPYLVVNPFFHMFGYKAGFLAAQLSGATVHPMPVFDAGQALDLIERERISFLPGPPTLFQSLLDHPEFGRRDLSSLRAATTGAADIPTDLIRRMHEELRFERIATSYGLTEALCVTSTRPGDDYETIAGTVGRAFDGVELRLVDRDGRTVETGVVGEVLVRGYDVMQGYLDDPDATAEAIVDGWLHTGDLGTLDARGYLRIVGRIKEMFIVGGFNAYPAEIESLLLGHPGVARAAVIGVPDARLGQVGMAFVVPAGSSPPDEDELIAWSRETMANYKAPRRIVFLDELPLNATGKVDKLALRERAGLRRAP